MTAAQAKAIVEKVRSERTLEYKAEYARILVEIERLAKRGITNFKIDREIEAPVQDMLRKDGYMVSGFYDQRDEPRTQIRWSND